MSLELVLVLGDGAVARHVPLDLHLALPVGVLSKLLVQVSADFFAAHGGIHTTQVSNIACQVLKDPLLNCAEAGLQPLIVEVQRLERKSAIGKCWLLVLWHHVPLSPLLSALSYCRGGLHSFRRSASCCRRHQVLSHHLEPKLVQRHALQNAAAGGGTLWPACRLLQGLGGRGLRLQDLGLPGRSGLAQLLHGGLFRLLRGLLAQCGHGLGLGRRQLLRAVRGEGLGLLLGLQGKAQVLAVAAGFAPDQHGRTWRVAVVDVQQLVCVTAVAYSHQVQVVEGFLLELVQCLVVRGIVDLIM
mmetsp:Transcript_23000/g.41155  ORF Transcript_23000/g.41155 Transcript_23000/m.41155 type:complete len:300 (+) Transcript_23000:2267-3166(+)